MKTIKLNGQHSQLECKVDDNDYDMLMRFKWHGLLDKGGKVYAGTTIDGNNFKMHRLIMIQAGHVIDGLVIDHKNEDTLDNQKENLRCVSNTVNVTSGKTKRKGSVLYDARNDNWKVFIRNHGTRHFVGNFKSELEGKLALQIFINRNAIETGLAPSL